MTEQSFDISFCMETLFADLPFMARLKAARELGIDGIEFWDYRDKDLGALENVVKQGHLRVTNFSGNRLHGMLRSSDRDAFLDEVSESAKIARRLQCPRLMLLVQPLNDNGSAQALPIGQSTGEITDSLIECALAAGALAEKADIDLVIEPLNTLIDHPGYFLSSSESAFKCIEQVNHPRIKLLYDIYHMAAMAEDALRDIEENLDKIGYFHIADLPGRHEPGTGSIDYREIFLLLRTLAFDGVIGFEFIPSRAGSTAAIQSSLELFK